MPDHYQPPIELSDVSGDPIERSKVVVLAGLGSFILANLVLVSLLVSLAGVREGRLGGDVLEAEIAATLYRLLTAVLAFGSLVGFWIWSIRVARSAGDTVGDGLGFGVGALVWSWLIPGVNAFLPFVLLRTVWARSKSAVGAAGTDWERTRPSWHWVACWSVFVCSVLLVIFSRWFQLWAPRPALAVVRAVYAEALGRLGLALVAVFAMMLVILVTRDQRARRRDDQG